MRRSSVDAVITGNTSVANWCNVLGVLDSVAQYLDGDAYELVCGIIETFPLQLSEPDFDERGRDRDEWKHEAAQWQALK